MKISEYAEYDGLGLAEVIRQGELTRQEVAEVAMRAVDQANESLNFLAHRTPIQTQQCLESDVSDRPFSGVPFLIKESAVLGEPWEMGSRLNSGYMADRDDEIVSRFRQSGVTILGISTMPELGNSATTESVLHGATRNPWNLSHSTGGSSGGAVAAVASGAVPIAHASDGGGSIRGPAACCGLVGLKPSRARTPGFQNGVYSLSTGHIVSRSVRDSAAMLDAIHGPEVGDVYHVPPPEGTFLSSLERPNSRLKIGFSALSPSDSALNPDVEQSITKAARVCEALGHDVVNVDLPYEWEPLRRTFLDLWSYRHPYIEQAMWLETGRETNSETRESCNLAMLEYGKSLSMSDFCQSLRHAELACRSVGEFFNDYDVFISPVNNHPALPLGQMNANALDLNAEDWIDQIITQFAQFTPIFNVTGQPAVSLPLFESREGLPIGVQFAAGFGQEALLLQLSRQLEQTLPWGRRRPQICLREAYD